MKYTRHHFYLFLLFSLLLACTKEGCKAVPSVISSITLDRVNHPNIYASMGWNYVSGGTCGLIVYNSGNDQLIAYDRCSPMDVGSKDILTVDGFTIVDKASGAKWMLSDGSPAAISECQLLRYNVRKIGEFYVVSN